MLIFLFQESFPVALGPLGTLLLSLLALASGSINVYQLYKSREAGAWRGAANAYEAELGIVRERAERLTTENKGLTSEVAVLKARTDLSQLAHDSSEQHAGIVLALRQLAEGEAQRYAQVTQMMTEQTKLILGHQTHTAGVFEHIIEQFRDIKTELGHKVNQ